MGAPCVESVFLFGRSGSRKKIIIKKIDKCVFYSHWLPVRIRISIGRKVIDESHFNGKKLNREFFDMGGRVMGVLKRAYENLADK